MWQCSASFLLLGSRPVFVPGFGCLARSPCASNLIVLRHFSMPKQHSDELLPIQAGDFICNGLLCNLAIGALELVGARCAYITAAILLGAIIHRGTVRLTNYDITRTICVASACHAITVPDNGTAAGDIPQSLQLVCFLSRLSCFRQFLVCAMACDGYTAFLCWRALIGPRPHPTSRQIVSHSI